MPVSHKLKLGEEVHDNLVRAIFDRVDYATGELESFYEDCRKGEEQFYAYIKTPKDEGSNQRTSRDENNRLEYQTIYIPYAYATAMTKLTYISTVFLSRSPIFQYDGRNAQAAVREQSVESYVDYQVSSANMRPVLFNWLLDPERYGVGIVGAHWKKDVEYISNIEEVEDLANFLTGKRRVLIEVPTTVYEGNELYNVRPLDFFRDPRYSILEFQKGEFCGEFTTVPTHVLDKGANDNTYIAENVKILKETLDQNTSGKYTRQHGSCLVGRETDSYSWKFLDRFKANSDKTPNNKWQQNVVEFYWTLVPKDWKLGTSPRPTKYYFCVSTSGLILSCMPMGNLHNKYPYAQLPFDVDAYKLTSRSGISIIEPMEKVLNWLINQHFYNVRKHLNNSIIIDPSRVVLKDLFSRNPGGFIRTNPTAYGTDPKTILHQLQNTDITRAHLADMRMMEEFAQRTVGINDNIMGLVHPGGRKTAQEVRTSSSFATNRLKMQAEWFSATGFSELSRIILKNSQQYMRQELKLRISGDLNGLAMEEIMVNREQIAGDFDFTPVDGTMPIDRTATASILQQMFQLAGGNPMLAQQFDMPGLFGYIGQLAGAKGLDRFRIQVLPPNQIQQGIQSGNLQAVQGGNSGATPPAGLPGVPTTLQ